jgi:hypothetical protein
LRKRKINPQYLRSITAQSVEDEKISVLEFSRSLKRFADDYLGGIMELDVSGTSVGTVCLKLPVVSYLVRLLCECGDNDEFIRASLVIADDVTLRIDYESSPPIDDAVLIIRVAKLAGFRVERYGNTLIFKADISMTSIMHVYAVTVEDFYSTLVLTHKM